MESAAEDKGFVDVSPSGDEEALQQALATTGPISIAIDASQPSFHYYNGGVYEVRKPITLISLACDWNACTFLSVDGLVDMLVYQNCVSVLPLLEFFNKLLFFVKAKLM